MNTNSAVISSPSVQSCTPLTATLTASLESCFASALNNSDEVTWNAASAEERDGSEAVGAIRDAARTTSQG